MEIVCTSLICNKPAVNYYILDQNLCNHKLPATEETKKDQIVFRKYFRETFYAIGEIQKLSSRFQNVVSRQFL